MEEGRIRVVGISGSSCVEGPVPKGHADRGTRSRDRRGMIQVPMTRETDT